MSDTTPDIFSIQLTKGRIAIVDAIDADLASLKWNAQVLPDGMAYARRGSTVRGKQFTLPMHNVILERILGHSLPKGYLCDHIDGDGLNNRRANLRLATLTDNNRNRRVARNNTSGATGVSWHKRDGIWDARIRVNYKFIHLGRFSYFEDAVMARKEAEMEYFGEFSPSLSRKA